MAIFQLDRVSGSQKWSIVYGPIGMIYNSRILRKEAAATGNKKKIKRVQKKKYRNTGGIINNGKGLKSFQGLGIALTF